MEKLNKLLFGIIGLWTFLAILFGLLDLEISKSAIIYRYSLWSELGDGFGDKVGEPLLILAITILIGSIFNDIKMQRKIGFVMILYACASLEFSVLTDHKSAILISGMMIIFLMTFFLLSYDKYWKQYVPIAISLILLIIILDITVIRTKIMWGRIRFTHLKSDTEFTEWYIINGNGNDNSSQSFPSGHTTIAWSFLPLLFLVRDKKIKKIAKMLLITSVIGFGLFIAISRVLRGAHYASDVLFSTGIAAILTILLYKLLYHLDIKIKDWNKNYNNPLIEIRYSHLTGEWLGIFTNENGKKKYAFFNNYEDAFNFSTRIKSLK